MEEEVPVENIKIKVEEQDLEEALNELMDQEEIMNDVLIQDEIIKNEILLDDINGDDLLGNSDVKEVQNHLPNGDIQFQNLIEKYTQIRKLGTKSRWLRLKSSLVKKKRALTRHGGCVKSNIRNKGGTQKKVLKNKAKKSKALSKAKKRKRALKSTSQTSCEQDKEDADLQTKELVECKQEPRDFEDGSSEPNPDTGISVHSDDTLYCDECCRSYEGDCPEHGPLFIIEDTTLPDDLDDKNRAEKTSPPQVSILNSEAENGVWARDAIPARTRFGPFEGKIVPPDVYTAYSWLVCKNGQPDHCVDATEPSLSNWMRYVNCARHNGQQNLHAFQFKGEIFYRSIRTIDPGEELLVWFGHEYGRQLGIDLQSGHNYTEMCPDCPYPCASPMYLLEHKKLSHKDLGTSEKTAKKAEEISRRNRRSYNRSAKLSVDYKDSPALISNHNSSDIDINVDDLKPTTNPDTGEQCFACPQCNKFILRRSHLKRHLLIHSDVKPFFCDFCSKGFSRKDNFDAHMKLRHPHEAIRVVITNSRKTPSPVKGSKPTDQSKERISPRGHLIRRQQTLFGKNQFVCNECDMRFSRAADVRAHMTVHQSEKPLVCDICKKRFVNKAGLTSHQKTVHKIPSPLVKQLIVKPKFTNPRRVKLNTALMCKVCGLQCRSEEHLTTHEHTHEDRFSVCFVCAKNFVHVNHLKRHLLIHAGYRPHGCPHCGQDFSRTEHLKRHIRTHTRQGAYECGKCKKRFAKKMDFDRHVRLHNKDAPCLQDQRLSMNLSLQRQLESYINDEENFIQNDCDDMKQEMEDYEEDEDEPLLNVFPEVILGAEN